MEVNLEVHTHHTHSGQLATAISAHNSLAGLINILSSVSTTCRDNSLSDKTSMKHTNTLTRSLDGFYFVALGAVSMASSESNSVIDSHCLRNKAKHHSASPTTT